MSFVESFSILDSQFDKPIIQNMISFFSAVPQCDMNMKEVQKSSFFIRAINKSFILASERERGRDWGRERGREREIVG